MISENFEVQFCTWYFCRWPGFPGLKDKPPQANFFRGTIFLNQSGIISNRNMPPSFCIKNPKENIFFYFFRQNLPPSFCTKNPKKIFSFSFLSKICLQRFFSFTFFFNPVQLIFLWVLITYIFRPVLVTYQCFVGDTYVSPRWHRNWNSKFGDTLSVTKISSVKNATQKVSRGFGCHFV